MVCGRGWRFGRQAVRGVVCAAFLAVVACGDGADAPDADVASEDAVAETVEDGDAAFDSEVPEVEVDVVPCNPFALRVVSFEPGEGAGTGADRFPEVVLGPPVGGGDMTGSTDVLTLGVGGTIVLEVGDHGIPDGPGADLIVFENVFLIGGEPTRPHAEPGHVAVSEDGETWFEFDCAYARYPFEGCAGWHPVYAAPGNGIDPTDPVTAGGDPFDLAGSGLTHARFIRIRDLGLAAPLSPSAGFDLDAVASVHGCR